MWIPSGNTIIWSLSTTKAKRVAKTYGWLLQKKKKKWFLVLEGRRPFKIFINFAASALQIITIKGWPWF